MVGEKPRQARQANPQLTLNLAPDPGYERENFFVSGSNEQAYAMIELWPSWPDSTLLILGPSGAGKSHLGAIWASLAKAGVRSAASLAAEDIEALAAAGPLLLDDADALGQSEARLFHLVNLMRERGATLVLTAKTPPDAWGLRTADLLSRLRLAPAVEIGPPDDALMRAVLVKLLIDRQLIVEHRRCRLYSFADRALTRRGARIYRRARSRGLGAEKPDLPGHRGRCPACHGPRLGPRSVSRRAGPLRIAATAKTRFRTRRRLRSDVADRTASGVNDGFPEYGFEFACRAPGSYAGVAVQARALGVQSGEGLAFALGNPRDFGWFSKILRRVRSAGRANKNPYPACRHYRIAGSQAIVVHKIGRCRRRR